MTVTVLLPVYNGATTLRQALDSILAQDDSDFELLVIDDGSTDTSSAIIEEYARHEPRITAVRHECNIGLAATLNEGLERARNELIVRMDQDDESLPTRLRVQRTYMDANPAVAAAGSWVLHMGAQPEFDRLVELPTTSREIASVIQRENCFYHPSMIMRRSVIRELGGYRREFRNAEDYDLWLRLSREHDLANIPIPLLRYRFSIGGMTLGRKWEQLYYVHLAQASNGDVSMTLPDAESVARSTLAGISRRWFMSQVAEGTVSELVKLRHWAEAFKVSTQLRNELGPIVAGKLIGFVAREYARSWKAA